MAGIYCVGVGVRQSGNFFVGFGSKTTKGLHTRE